MKDKTPYNLNLVKINNHAKLIAEQENKFHKNQITMSKKYLRSQEAFEDSINEPNIKAALMYLDEAIDKYAEALQREGFNLEIVKGKSGDVIVITLNPVSTSCTSDDPDDMCENCTCWKATRKNCS